MRIETCPRCGTKRPDELQWCRKCGLDFHKAERGELPPPDPARIRTVPDYWHDADTPPTMPTPHARESSRVRLEVDHRWLARLLGNLMDVTLLASIGAAIGYAAAIAFGSFVDAGSQDVFAIVVMRTALAMVGGWLGARLALWLIAHWPTA